MVKPGSQHAGNGGDLGAKVGGRPMNTQELISEAEKISHKVSRRRGRGRMGARR